MEPSEIYMQMTAKFNQAETLYVEILALGNTPGYRELFDAGKAEKAEDATDKALKTMRRAHLRAKQAGDTGDFPKPRTGK